MAETKTLRVKIRSPGGTRAARRTRESGRLPGIVYGHGEVPVAISLKWKPCGNPSLQNSTLMGPGHK